MASFVSSSLPQNQGSGPFAPMEQTQKKPGIHSLSWEAEKGSKQPVWRDKGTVGWPCQPSGEAGPPGRPSPPPLPGAPTLLPGCIRGTGATVCSGFPDWLLESLTFSNLFFHPVTDLSQENYVSFSSFEGKSATSTQKKCSETYSIPQTGPRRGESIQEMLKKVKVRRVLIALPDAGVSPEIHREQS